MMVGETSTSDSAVVDVDAERPAIAMADTAEAEEAHRGMRRLRRQACGWLGRPDTLQYLAPDFSEIPEIPKAKACTELGLLRMLWARVRPDDSDLAVVTKAVDAIWADPTMADRVPTTSRFFRQYTLSYGAFAPPGAHLQRAALEKIAPQGRLQTHGKSSHLHLEARYYADLAGLEHEFESYRTLYDNSLLAGATELITDSHEAYMITHTLFFTTDFGRRQLGITEDARRRALILVDQMTDYFVADEHWDLIGELLLCQHCLGQDPTRTKSGAAGVRSLLAVQTPDGRIPARYAAKRPLETESAFLLFKRAYHTTLVTALVSLLSLAPDGDQSP